MKRLLIFASIVLCFTSTGLAPDRAVAGQLEPAAQYPGALRSQDREVSVLGDPGRRRCGAQREHDQ